MQLLRRLAVVACGVALAGCYEYQPADYTAATPGTEMSFDISDAGRVALGGSMGPEIATLSGRVIDGDSVSYMVAVTDVKFLRGGEQVWTGEKVRLQKTYISRYYEKRFSKARTVMMSAIGAGAVALIASQAIVGGGPVNNELPPDTSAQKIRIPRP